MIIYHHRCILPSPAFYIAHLNATPHPSEGYKYRLWFGWDYSLSRLNTHKIIISCL